MMEENSEINMDTNVSSTTQDIPDTQEVTGSHGNVEMVIVVEKIDEDLKSLANKQSLSSSENDNSGSVDLVQSTEKCPQGDVHTQMMVSQSPSKDNQQKAIKNSPAKQELLQPSLLKPEVTQNTPSKLELQQKFTKPELLQKLSKQEEQQKSPLKQDFQQKSPSKQEGSQKSLLKPELQHKSPSKQEGSQKSLLKPESQQKFPSKQEGSQKSPSKLDIPQNSPAKQDLMQKSLSKELNIIIESPIKISQSNEVNTGSEDKTQAKEDEVNMQKNPCDDAVSQKASPNYSISQLQSEELVKVTTNKDSLETDKASQKILSSNINKNVQEEFVTVAIPVDIEKEASNDSQIETNSDTSEKEHNKSISRELKSLINSAKESKIISECTQLTTKTRKSRTAADSSNTNLNTSVEADKIQGSRRGSNNSQKSNCSEKSEKVTLKRSMRSQNPEFVNKVKLFLNSVTGKFQKGDSDMSIMSDDDTDESKVKNNTEPTSSTPKKKKTEAVSTKPEKNNKLRSDSFCWRCHWAVEQTNEKSHPPMQCTVCPRSFHYKCLSGTERNKVSLEKNWVCPDCIIILHAESSETRSLAMKKIPLGMLCELLKYALERMMDLNGVEPFMHPVDRTAFPDYDKYVVHPMDLSLMKDNIAAGLYGSTEAFLADVQWILHNSIIFNTR